MAEEEVSVEITGDSSGLESAIGSAQESLGNMKGAVAGLGLAMSGLAAGAMTKAVGAAADFEESMTDVQRVTDPETAEAMGSAIKDMAARMPVAQSELAAIAEQAGRLGVESDNLEAFTETAAKMAASTDLSAEEAADSMARIGTLMDIPMDQAENLGSAIDRLANNFGTSSSEIADAMTRASGSLNTLGIGEDMALGMSAALNEVSVSSEVAGTGLRTVAESLMKPSKVQDVADALGMTEEEFVNMRDSSPEETLKMLAQKMNEGGETSQRLRDALGKQATTLEKLGGNWDAVEEATGAAGEEMENAQALQKDFDQATETFNAKLQIAKNQLRNVAISLGQALLPAINTVLGKIMPLVEGFGQWIQQGNNAKIAALALAGAFTAGLIPAITMAAPMIAGLAVAAAAPVAAIAALTAAVSGLAIAWEENFAGIRTATMDVVRVIKRLFLATVQELQATVRPILTDLSAAFDTSMGASEQSVRGLINIVANRLIEGLYGAFAQIQALLQQARTWWQAHGDEVIATLQQLIARTRQTLAGIEQALRQVIQPVLQQATAWWAAHQAQVQRIVQKIETLVQTVLGGVLAWLGTALTQLATVTEMALGKIQQLWNAWGDEITTLIQFVVDYVLTIAGIWLDALETLIDVALAAIQGDWETVWTEITGFLDRTLTTIIGFVREWGPKLAEIVIAALTLVAEKFVEFGSFLIDDFFPQLWTTVVDLARQFGPTFREIIINALNLVLEKFIEFGQFLLNDFFPQLWTTVVDLARQFGPTFREIIINALNLVLEKFIEFGKFLLNDLFPELWNKVLTLAQEFGPKFIQWTIETLNRGLEVFIEFGSFLVNDLFPELWDTLLTLAEEWGTQFVQWAIDGLNLVLDTFIEFGSFLVNDLFPELWDTLTTLAENFGNDFEQWAINALNTVLDLFREFDTLLVGEEGIIPSLWDTILSKADTFANDLETKIQTMIGDITNWLKTTGKTLMKNAWDKLAQGAKNAFNNVIPSDITIGPWKEAGVTILEEKSFDLPQLAHGAVVSGPTLALVGEGTEDEFVAPRSTLERELRRIADQAAGGGGGQPVVIDAPDDALIRVGDLNSMMRETFDDKWDEKRRRLR